MLVDIPDNIFADVRNEAQGLPHGIINLSIHIRDYHVHFYKVGRERSNITPSVIKPEGEQGTIKSYSDNHSRMSKGMKK